MILKFEKPLKKRVLDLCCSIVLLLVPMGVSFAQSLITLEQAQAEGLLKNPELRAVRFERGIAKAFSVESYLPFPSGLEVEYENSSDKRFANEGERATSFSLSQEIEWPVPYLLRRSIASLNLQMRESEIRRQETLTRTGVADAFYALLTAQEKLKASETIVALNQQLADISDQRFSVGDISELNYNLVLAEKEQSEAENFLIRQKVESAKIALNRLIGREAGALTVVAPETSLAVISLDEKVLVDEALQRRADFAAANFMAKSTSRSLSKSWLNLIPNPVVSATWLKETSVFEISNPAEGSDSIIDRDKHFAWTVGFSLPLANFNLAGGELTRAKAEKNVAEARREAMRTIVVAEVKDAAQSYQKAFEAYGRYRQLLPRLTTNIELLTRAFESGQIDLATLLFQKDRLNRSQIAYWDTFLNLKMARNALERAVGGELK